MSFNTPNNGGLAIKSGGENRESVGLLELCSVSTDTLG